MPLPSDGGRERERGFEMAISQTRLFEFDYPTSPLLCLIHHEIVVISVWTGLSMDWIGLSLGLGCCGVFGFSVLLTFQILRPITCVAWA